MLTKNKKLLLTVFIVLVALLVGLFFVRFRSEKLIFDEFQINGEADEYVPIYAGHTVGQEFTPKYKNLCKLGFVISKDTAAKTDLILHIKSSRLDKQDILKIAAKTDDLRDKYYPFKFPPVHLSEGYAYFFEFEPLKYALGNSIYFYLEAPAAKPEDAFKIGYCTNVFHRGNAGGESYLDNSPWKGYLFFHNYYLLSDKPGEIISEIAARIWRDPVFIVSYFILCTLVVVGIFIIWRQEKTLKE